MSTGTRAHCVTTEPGVAEKELEELCNELESTGLHSEVRAGFEQTLLIFVKAPRDLLGNTVYKSRYIHAQCPRRLLFIPGTDMPF